MPIFLSSSWLFVLLPIAAIGVIALWRGRHNVQRISSTWLWQGLMEEGRGSKARSLDPLWALLLLAALLAALALARPIWILHAAALPEPLPPQMAMRGIAGDPHTQLFVRWPATATAHTPFTVEVSAGDWTHNYLCSAAALEQGMVFSDIPAAKNIDVIVHNGIASSTSHFQRNDAQPFAILRAGAPMPALERIMALQPGAQLDDTTLRPAVWLIDDPNFHETDFNPGTQSVVIVSPRTPITGITTEQLPHPSNPSPSLQAQGLQSLGLASSNFTPQPAAQSPLLSSVSFQDVHVHHYITARLSNDWTILATVADHPWLASSTDSQTHTLWVWQASTLSLADTNWPLDPSFVIFFSNVAAHLRQTESTSTHVIDWTMAPSSQVTTAYPPRSIPFAPWLLALSGVLILVVMVTLARRG